MVKSVHDTTSTSRPSALGAVSDGADVGVLKTIASGLGVLAQIDVIVDPGAAGLAAPNEQEDRVLVKADEMAAYVPSRAVHQLTASSNCGTRPC